MQDMYYRQVAQLYKSVNGPSEFCEADARACGNHTTTSQTDNVNSPFPLPTDTPAFSEKIHIALMELGLTNDKRTTVKFIALRN